MSERNDEFTVSADDGGAGVSPSVDSTAYQGRGGQTLELENFLPYRVSVLSNTVSRAIASAYSKQFGLTIPEWRVLAVLGRFPDISAKQAAELTAMDKVQVSRAVAALIAKGHVKRRTHRHDRRYSILRHSAKGHSIYERVVPLALGYERLLLDALTASERHAVDCLLSKLQRLADTL